MPSAVVAPAVLVVDGGASLRCALVGDQLAALGLGNGWAGVVISDDLQAAAITQAYGADEAVALAIEAGIDLLLFANQQVYDADIVAHVTDAVLGFVASGRITEARLDESVVRIEGLFNPVE